MKKISKNIPKQISKEPIKKYRADKQTDTNYFYNIDSNFTKQTFCFFKF